MTTGEFEDYEDLMADERSTQYELLKEELRQHPGVIATRRWDELKRSHRTWGLNIIDLRALLLVARDNEELKVELIQNVRAPMVRDAFFAGLDQRLHNMIAGAVSLVDITRGLIKKYPKSHFAHEFESRNSDVANSPGTAFLRKFRNYLLHVGNAPFITTGSVQDADDDKSSFVLVIKLSSEALLADSSFEWNAASRGFIESNPDGILLLETLEEYVAAMEMLYGWIFAQFEILHSDDIDATNDLVRRINLTMTAGAHDGTNMEAFWTHVAENGRRADRGEPQIDFQTGLPIEDE